MDELVAGVWHWQGAHPAYTEPHIVSSYAVDVGDRLLLFDPIAPPDELMRQAETRELAVVLTNPWHERETRGLVERNNLSVFSPRPDERSPDIAWLLTGETGELHFYAADGLLPAGVDAVLPGRQANDLVLWIGSRRSVVVGDTLVDFGAGLEIHEPWLWTTTREQVIDQLRPLLDLPVEHVLATHGGSHDRAALERVLA
jgi:hypothetical protein